MSDEEPPRPTPRMVRLYQTLSEMLGGEPPDLWVYEPEPSSTAPGGNHPSLKHVMVWPADDQLDVTTFNTVGMSERPIPGTDYAAELHFAVRKFLRTPEREELARFLANVAEYPFDHNRTLDWWHTLANPGPIPQFPGCRHLLMHPRFTAEGFDSIDDPDGPVKLFYVVPITPHERHLLVAHGPDAFQTYVSENGIDLLADRTDPPGSVGIGPEDP